MINTYLKLIANDENKTYSYVTNVINSVEPKKSDFMSDVIVKRDEHGYISTVNYYSENRELVKEVLYNFNQVNGVNYYRNGYKYCHELLQNDRCLKKTNFNRNGQIISTLVYEYDEQGRITSLRKICQGRDILISYHYDDLDRIVSRYIKLNDSNSIEQHYVYDILDRVISYSDRNQQIIVNKTDRNNNLISYEITDRMGKTTKVENYFSANGYLCTSLTVNGQKVTVKEKNYVDNVMMEKPFVKEEDIDVIISNLFNTSTVCVNSRCDFEQKSSEMIDSSIEARTLPISMRKRVLYNMSLQA